ncbi:MAG: cytochrome c oxidase subunit II [Actinomycetia bacterium]|nr:cytochrome c oxidase subunit II [Actinomycetes bacterium]
MPRTASPVDAVRRRGRPRRLAALVAVVVGTVLLTGCERTSLADGLLIRGVTEGSDRVTRLWIGTWIAAIAVGVLVLALLFWCLIVYRRKDGDDELPEQLRYNVPIEVLYTVVPIFIVAVLFYYTARDEEILLDTTERPIDNVVNVVGKRWSWDFNYVNENVHLAGTQAELTGEDGVEETLPTLYLPVNERTQFVLTSRDVIHSFWVPVFHQKLDMIPGRVNTFAVTPTQTGVFQGKCAELCGDYHAYMLFNVAIVERDEYEAHMQELADSGQSGLLPNDVNMEPIMERDLDLLPAEDAGGN